MMLIIKNWRRKKSKRIMPLRNGEGRMRGEGRFEKKKMNTKILSPNVPHRGEEGNGKMKIVKLEKKKGILQRGTTCPTFPNSLIVHHHNLPNFFLPFILSLAAKTTTSFRTSYWLLQAANLVTIMSCCHFHRLQQQLQQLLSNL